MSVVTRHAASIPPKRYWADVTVYVAAAIGGLHVLLWLVTMLSVLLNLGGHPPFAAVAGALLPFSVRGLVIPALLGGVIAMLARYGEPWGKRRFAWVALGLNLLFMLLVLCFPLPK
jgi:hypothetical protein